MGIPLGVYVPTPQPGQNLFLWFLAVLFGFGLATVVFWFGIRPILEKIMDKPDKRK
jgi:hypothetical protein